MLLVSFTVSFGLFDLHPLTTSRKANWFYGALTLFVITTVLVYVQLMYHPFFAVMFAISAIIPFAIAVTLPMNMNRGDVKYYKEIEKHVEKAETREVYRATANHLSITGTMNMSGDVYFAVM
jgi:cytochrome b subunit of formate dehydrogenase